MTFLLATFVLWCVAMMVHKPVFLLLYAGDLTQVLSVMWHGLPLDLSMAGYLTAWPALLLLVGAWPWRRMHTPGGVRIQRWLYMGWVAVAAVAVAASFVANWALYGYWHFPLDATPLFFLTSSPRDAVASVTGGQALLGLTVMAAYAAWIGLAFRWLCRRFGPAAFAPLGGRGWAVMLVWVALLFLPIRGGLTVSSMNTGKAYFSRNQLLNHAAVNPLFSFMESVTHQEDFGSQYRFMGHREAQALVRAMDAPEGGIRGHETERLLSDGTRPDIYLIILESFSDTLMRQPGVTPTLRQLQREGVWFSRFYANSFRTDRGLLSILHGYPAPATVSLMKYPRKTASLPSLPAALRKAGWGLSYYYGGDADFTNMRSFLVNQGFDDITEDVDFPVRDRLSKWGVPDHLLLARVRRDLAARPDARPMLRVIQTSSSHEPFDVPYHRFADKALNAFAYTDHHLGEFVAYLRRSGRWDRSLLILVPDHLGAWPEGADNFRSWRYHIPMIWAGGCVKKPMEVRTYGSQQDIAATVLGQLGLPHGQFRYSKDMLHAQTPHYAFFLMNDGLGLIDDGNEVIYDNKLRQTIVSRGRHRGRNLRRGQAYLQLLYDDIASR